MSPLMQAPEPATGLPWVDKVAIVLLALFAVLGVWRGLWWQVVRLVGFVAAIAAARTLSPKVEPLLTETFGITDPRFSQGLAWVALFVAGLTVFALLGLLGRRVLETMQLGLVDRVGGALAGAVTALCLHAAFLASMTFLAPGDWLQEQLAGSWSEGLLDHLAQRWPVLVDEPQGQWLQQQLQAGRVL